MSLVSVIIPAFNAGRFLHQTLQSAIDQSWTNLEVLLVDDRSTDDTRRIAEKFDDSRIRILAGQGQGAGAARNVGLQHASGRFIQFLDADDILSPQKIEQQINALNQLDGGPLSAIASCVWAHFQDSIERAIIQPQPVWTTEDAVQWSQDSLLGGGMMQTAGWLCPREIIDRAGPWDESLSLHDDGEYFTRVLLKAKKQIHVPEATVYYRTVADSLSRRRDDRAIESAFSVCEQRARHLLKVDSSRRTRRALATLMGTFVYEFANRRPDLAARANDHIRQFGVNPANCIGGRAFRTLRRFLGWTLAVRCRHLRNHQPIDPAVA